MYILRLYEKSPLNIDNSNTLRKWSMTSDATRDRASENDARHGQPDFVARHDYTPCLPHVDFTTALRH